MLLGADIDSKRNLVNFETGACKIYSKTYFELKDEMRSKIIKMAFDLDAAIVELHSHPYPEPAKFSYSDLGGFDDFVAHVWWRLKGKPCRSRRTKQGSLSRADEMSTSRMSSALCRPRSSTETSCKRGTSLRDRPLSSKGLPRLSSHLMPDWKSQIMGTIWSYSKP